MEKKGYFCVFVAGALWGSIGIFVKQLGVYGYSAGKISFLRAGFAFLIMAVICLAKGGVRFLAIDRRTLFSCALLGIVCHGIYNIWYSAAVTMAGVAVSAVLLEIAPVCTLLFSMLLFGEKCNMRKGTAIIVNVVGCVLAVTNGKLGMEKAAFVGVMFGIGAGVCYSLTAIFGKLAAGKTNSYLVSMYSYLFAVLFLGIWSRPWNAGFVWNGKIVIWGFLYALIPTAIAYVIYYYGIQMVAESSKVPVIASVEIVIAALIGFFLYQEQLGILSVAGIGLVLLSIVLMSRKA